MNLGSQKSEINQKTTASSQSRQKVELEPHWLVDTRQLNLSAFEKYDPVFGFNYLQAHVCQCSCDDYCGT